LKQQSNAKAKRHLTYLKQPNNYAEKSLDNAVCDVVYMLPWWPYEYFKIAVAVYCVAVMIVTLGSSTLSLVLERTLIIVLPGSEEISVHRFISDL
jgi:hypothetical protein